MILHWLHDPKHYAGEDFRMNHRLPRFTTTSMLITVFFIGYILAAYTRGQYLLGAGVMYGVVAVLITALFYRALSHPRSPRLRFWLLAMFAFPVSLAFAFPTYLNRDLQHFVNKQTTDRNARLELARLFGSDPAFADLGVSTTHLKVVNVQVRGSVQAKADLHRLQSRVLSECQFVDSCVVHWYIHVHEDSQAYSGLDDEDFGSSIKMIAR